MATPNLAHWSSNGTERSKGQTGCWASPVHQTVTIGFHPPKLKLGDQLGSLSKGIFERMSTGNEEVSLALTLASLHADRDDLPKNLPKTTGQESKTSTSVWRVSFKNVFVLSSLLSHPNAFLECTGGRISTYLISSDHRTIFFRMAVCTWLTLRFSKTFHTMARRMSHWRGVTPAQLWACSTSEAMEILFP